MDPYAWIALLTLAGVVVLFITKWLPMEATALAVPVVLAATGTLANPADALAGFGSHAVIAIAAIFILGMGLQKSGVATLLARAIERLGGGSEAKTTAIVMATVCMLSAFMSSAATVAVFLPAVSVLARRTGSPASRLMMPLAYAAIMGGTLTLIGTTPNLLLGELLEREGESLGMFEFALVGAPVAALGIVYMATLGRRVLPTHTTKDRLEDVQMPEDVANNYGFVQNLYRMEVLPQSGVAGKTIEQAQIGGEYDLDVVLIYRPGALGRRYLHPRPDLVLEPADQLYLEGEMEAAQRFADAETLEFGRAGPRSLDRILERGLTLAEVTLAPHSRVFGKSFKELAFRSHYGLNVISVWRRGKTLTSGTGDIPLELGDAFLVTGPPDRVRELAKEQDYVVMTDDSQVENVQRAPIAIGLMLLALVPPILGWLPLAVSAIGSALLMIGTRCLSLADAKQSIDWRVLFLIIGLIPLGTAIEQRGVATEAAEAIVWIGDSIGDSLGNPAILFCLFALSALIAVTCNNAAAAVILAPIAAEAAPASGIELSTAFLAVAYGASCAYVLPFGNQCNLMVMGPGGYTPRDYWRAGAGLTVLVTVATVVLLSIL